MADDEAHYRAVQEIVNRQKSSIAPFGVPPTAVTRPEPGPATESVPDPRTWQPQLDQLRRPPRSAAALEAASTWVPSPAHADPEAPFTIVRSDTALALAAATAAAITKQEQPDHPRSHISPGVQDQPAAPSAVQLQGRVTIMARASAGMTIADAVSTSDPQALHAEMLRRIKSLELELQKLSSHSVGIGHNHPPEPIDPVPFGDDDRRAVDTAILVLSAQPPKPETPPVEAGEAAAKLMTIGERLKAYAIKQGDVFVSEAVKSAGAELGKRIIQSPFWLTLAGLLIAVATAVSAWIASLPAPH
jgi:hypothetical protein